MFTREEIVGWLHETDPDRLGELYRAADDCRRGNVGDAVHLRGLIELSNYCRRNCLYCGIRAERRNISRYRMTRQEILDTVATAKHFGYGTVVLQAGEDAAFTSDFVAEVVEQIKSRYGLAVTLSLGEQTDEVFLRWKSTGADRYLLRFETSNPQLFAAIHPHRTNGGLPKSAERLEMLRRLRQMGFEIGSGVMIGIPGQSAEMLADDLLTIADLDLDMIGTGPFLSHPETPLGIVADALASGKHHNEAEWGQIVEATGFNIPIPPDSVPPTIEMGFKVIALTRLLRPDANIPSTTAVATLDPNKGRITGLACGANVVMPNLTPRKYRALYEIYPNKAALLETAAQTHSTALRQIAEAGRSVGRGPGGRGAVD